MYRAKFDFTASVAYAILKTYLGHQVTENKKAYMTCISL